MVLYNHHLGTLYSPRFCHLDDILLSYYCYMWFDAWHVSIDATICRCLMMVLVDARKQSNCSKHILHFSSFVYTQTMTYCRSLKMTVSRFITPLLLSRQPMTLYIYCRWFYYKLCASRSHQNLLSHMYIVPVWNRMKHAHRMGQVREHA